MANTLSFGKNKDEVLYVNQVKSSVKKIFEFARALWTVVQLKSPPFIQRRLLPFLHEVKEIARIVGRFYLPVFQLKESGQAEPLDVTYAGLGFAKPFLQSTLFVDEPTEEQIGRIPFLKTHQLTAIFPGDITVIEVPKHFIGKLSSPNSIVLPEFVRHVVNVQGDWQEVEKRFHKTVRKNDLRRVRKYGYEYDISYDPQDFEEFYHQMYLPTMNNRHKDLSMPGSYYQMYQRFLHGFLFRINRNSTWVSGGICHNEQDVLVLDFVGVKNGDSQLIKEGALTARYYAAIHWANKHNYKAVDFLGSDPYLRSGLFQYKRKWGSSIYLPSRMHRRIWIKVNRNTPAVTRFLQETPVVIIDEEGNLHGLIAVKAEEMAGFTADTIEKLKGHYETPGLKTLIVRPIDNFVKSASDTGLADIIIPITSTNLENNP